MEKQGMNKNWEIFLHLVFPEVQKYKECRIVSVV